MQFFIPHGWTRCVVPVALTLASSFALAQTPTEIKKPLRPDPFSAELSVEAVPYRSAFTGYRPLRDEPVAAWKNSNDLTGKIGGWRVYAREAGQPDAATESAVSPTTPQVKDHAVHQGGQQ
ncbi:hypothetical protein RGU70_12155 [Herbaspirillum sp. RTI4]|uniref:hypothetical protein n=1 Tax=Herbaspirillum sp. RTI4 TaxID=3048640 RepID=UPI002AB3F363|nr:hypothetical protein [Herbaspirillum sp. RTI4]MDY7579076.1 hypothetical protein [Herbaspirillum sp. RTI4]MEA9982340.1 hypothetical protein [Herbaspirillum sp. RTI4]